MRRRVRVASDNAAVVANALDLRRAALKAKPLAGLYRALRAISGEETLEVRKVAGHQQPGSYPAGTTAWLDAVGNKLADSAANAGTAMHVRDVQCMQLMQKLADIADAAVRIGDQEWDKWPVLGSFAQYQHAPAADVAPAPPRPRHRWAREQGTRYRCQGCGKVTSSLSHQAIGGLCKGRQAVTGIALVLLHPKEHCPVAVYCGDAAPRIACLRCGAWPSGRPVNLLRRCTGAPTLAGRAALHRLAQGRNPVGSARIEGAYHVIGGEVAFDAAVQFI